MNDAFKLVKRAFFNSKLVIMGAGSQKTELENRIHHHQLGDDVLFTGFIKNAKKFMHQFDVFVLPSLTEGLPITLIEAMQARRPIVATRVGGIPSMIQDKKSGILVEPQNAQSLADGIAYVLKHPERSAAMTQEAFSSAQHRFSAATMALNYFDLYRHILIKTSQKGLSS